MTPWQMTVQEVMMLDPHDLVDCMYAEAHVLMSFTDQPEEVVQPMFEDLIIPLKGSPANDNLRHNLQRLLDSLIMKLSKEHQFVLIKTIIVHLAEDLQTSEPNWIHLWGVVGACTPYVNHHPQRRQIRFIARKFIALHTERHYFINDQFILLPKQGRLNRLERFEHFRQRNPKWLTEKPAK